VNHDCIFKPTPKTYILPTLPHKLYREVDNKITEKLSPEEIYIGAKNKIISKADASKYLVAVIEHSRDTKMRVEAIDVFNKLVMQNKSVFKILENTLVSDENKDVRSAAVKTLIKNFPKECIRVIEWVIDHETSDFVLKALKNTLKSVENKYINNLKKKILNKSNDGS